MSINGKTLAFLVGMALFGAFTWALLSPLFIDRTVDEARPDNGFQLPTREQVASMSRAQRFLSMRSAIKQMAELPPQTVAEEMPAQALVTVSSGRFSDYDALHKGEGQAIIYGLPEGGGYLRLEQFRVTNGPALRVYLAHHPAPANAADVRSGFADLGALKGNVGDQNYVLPETLATSDYGSVVIWCELFNVIFSVAPLVAIPVTPEAG